MPTLDLLEPLLDGGVRHANAFDGRILTAEALTTERAALHRHADRLGQAIGEGVAFGLDVTRGPVRNRVPTLDVTPGLAVNRKGQTLCIPEAVGTVEVALSREPRVRDLPEGTGAFEACRPGDRFEGDDFQAKLDPGAYVLVIGPASAYEGRVPGVGAGDGGVATFCGSRYATEGVYLRLVSLRLGDEVARLVAADVRSDRIEDRTRARNVLAHHCLGTPYLGRFRASPRTAGARYGLLDDMRETGDVDACEVSLALVFWDEDEVRFVDPWAVRRRLAATGASDAWRLHALPRRLVEAEATFLQFQDQMQETGMGGRRLDAVEAFRYLPSAGYVPAVASDVFFEQIEVRQRLRADEAFLRALVHDALHADAIDLAADPRPAVDLYDCPSSGQVLFVRAADVAAVERPVEPGGGLGALVVTVDLDPDERPGSLTIGEHRERESLRRVETHMVPVSDTPPRGTEAGHNAEIMRLMAMGANVPAVREDDIDSLTARVRARITVEAVHRETGTVTEGSLDTGAVKSRLAARTMGRMKDSLRELRYTFPPLAPGPTLVRLRGEGVQSQSTQRDIEAESTERVAFDLFPAKAKPPSKRRPPKTVPAGDLGPGWFETATLNDGLLDAYARWPWRADERERYEKIEEIPPEVVGFLDDWGDEIRIRYPDAPVASEVAVYLDPSYTPDGTPPDAPYAYATFGEGGAYVPLVLAPSTRTLGHPVGVGKSGLFGGDAGIERRLGEVGADEIDVLANAWGGLVEDATGVGPEAAREVVGAARRAAEDLQDDLGQFTGVSPALADALAEAGFRTPTDLANASPDALLSALGENTALTPVWATLLIGEARASVPASAWSLDTAVGDAGLRDALAGVGVVSLGDLERRDAGEVAGAAGVSPERLREVASEAANARAEAATRVVTARRANAPVSGVEGVEATAALTLARSGFATTRALALANAVDVARTLGVEEGEARGLITNAGRRLGL